MTSVNGVSRSSVVVYQCSGVGFVVVDGEGVGWDRMIPWMEV